MPCPDACVHVRGAVDDQDRCRPLAGRASARARAAFGRHARAACPHSTRACTRHGRAARHTPPASASAAPTQAMAAMDESARPRWSRDAPATGPGRPPPRLALRGERFNLARWGGGRARNNVGRHKITTNRATTSLMRVQQAPPTRCGMRPAVRLRLAGPFQQCFPAGMVMTTCSPQVLVLPGRRLPGGVILSCMQVQFRSVPFRMAAKLPR